MTASSLETAGHGLTAALYVLNRCPIHSRYVRRGTGERRLCEVEQFVINSVEVSLVEVRVDEPDFSVA